MTHEQMYDNLSLEKVYLLSKVLSILFTRFTNKLLRLD